MDREPGAAVSPEVKSADWNQIAWFPIPGPATFQLC